jgi:hypothetical protein
LSGINDVVTTDLYNQLKWVWTGNKINGQNIKQIEWMIEKWSGKNWLNVVDKIEELSTKLDHLKWGNLDKYDELLGSLWKVKAWVWWAIKWVWVLGSLFESYNDYKDFDKLLEWDEEKVFIATTTTTAWKVVISSNPVDFIMDISAGVTGLFGYEEESKKIQEYTLWNRFKQTIQDAYTNDAESIMSAIDQRASDFLEVYNDPNAWVIEKSSDFLQFSLTAWYWWIVAATKEWIWFAQWAIDSFTSWLDRIQSLFGR